jgi:hypothetical protein
MRDETKLEGLKMQYEALLTEYSMVRGHVANSRELQSQLDNISLAALGISIPLVLGILDRSMDLAGTILFIPTLFLAVAFIQIRHERILLVAAMYADSELRPRINKLLSQISSAKVQVFQWEQFLSKGRWAKGLLLEWLSIISHTALPFYSAIGVAAIYAYIRLSLSHQGYPFEIWLLVVNGVILLVDLFTALRIAQIRVQYYKEQRYS